MNNRKKEWGNGHFSDNSPCKMKICKSSGIDNISLVYTSTELMRLFNTGLENISIPNICTIQKKVWRIPVIDRIETE